MLSQQENCVMIFKQDSNLNKLLPQTEWLTYRSLWDMLDRYDSVIVKPVVYHDETPIILVHSLGSDQYEVDTGYEQKTIQSKKNLYSFLRKLILDKTAKVNYWVEQWLPLAKLDHRPFHIRVVMQKLSNTPWEITAKLAKLTNYTDSPPSFSSNGSTTISIEKALRNSSLNSELDHIALKTTKLIEKHFPACQKINLDLGLDVYGNLWIIQADFKPENVLFLKLEEVSPVERTKAVT
ncbi:YheC/YheD family protein [Ammoniphilus sp. YIM 78166]|uniref:YheC/YheD family protein n=1 Tax=Ammoniphilus sp. YIM 78166 TaxID=1644106 RepID=UPI0010700254|nr:YheC/YheD family protein [Ammoniphilus sp. YIM 78166]